MYWGIARACAAHKVQDVTLHKTVVSLDLVKQKTFSPGQIYVALSSWTSFSKLNMVSKFYPKIISEIQLALEQ